MALPANVLFYNLAEGGMSASYLIVGDKAALLVDTGAGDIDEAVFTANLKKYAGDKPVTLVTTHLHQDHTAYHRLFPEYYMHPADHAILQGEIASVYKALTAGQIFDLGGVTLEIVELPGHTPGSIGVLDRANRYICTGDMVCTGTIFMVDGQCDFDDFAASMEKLLNLGVDNCLCCHADSVVPVAHCKRQLQNVADYKAGKLTEGPGMFGGGSVFTAEDGSGFFRPGA
jgi:glyoxylase-like metal-dependent hydrolase (beta-lactamase superfamily II)